VHNSIQEKLNRIARFLRYQGPPCIFIATSACDLLLMIIKLWQDKENNDTSSEIYRRTDCPVQ